MKWNVVCTGRSAMTRSLALLTAAALAAGCSQPAPKTGAQPAAAAAAAAPNGLQTIDNTDLRPAALDPPPMLTDEGATTPKPKVDLAQPDAPPPPTAQDEALRASLPFAPAIAMDPIDGSKISIRASTPQFELKGKIYYFSSEENKRMFASNPEQYQKGVFSHL
jgi:YHS domain-containing protein